VRQAPLQRKANEPDVQGAALEGVQLGRRGHVPERNVDLGVGAPEARDEAGHEEASGDAEPEAQLAQLAAGRAPHPVENPVGLVEQGSDLFREELADLRQPGPVAAANEEGRAHLVLELPHLFGEGRLAEVQRAGGAAKVALLRKHLERPEESDLHIDNHRLSYPSDQSIGRRAGAAACIGAGGTRLARRPWKGRRSNEMKKGNERKQEDVTSRIETTSDGLLADAWRTCWVAGAWALELAAGVVARAFGGRAALLPSGAASEPVAVRAPLAADGQATGGVAGVEPGTPLTLRQLGLPRDLASEFEAVFRLMGRAEGDLVAGYTFVAPDGACHPVRLAPANGPESPPESGQDRAA
jgi:hypothetical protein